MKKYGLLSLLSLLLLSSCVSNNEIRSFENAIHYRNDDAKDVDISRSDKAKIIKVIKNISFRDDIKDQVIPFQNSDYDLGFSFSENGALSLSYLVDIEQKIILKRITNVSSTTSDEYALLSNEEIKIFASAFNIVIEDATKGIKTWQFFTNYDYGFHIENKVTLLLGGALFFFNGSDYGIKQRVNAGDIFTLYYEGELLIQETYPSTVDTRNMTILDIRRAKAHIVAGNILKNSDSNQYEFISEILPPLSLTPNVVEEEGLFSEVTNYYEKKVYATYSNTLTITPTISALYSFLPV